MFRVSHSKAKIITQPSSLITRFVTFSRPPRLSNTKISPKTCRQLRGTFLIVLKGFLIAHNTLPFSFPLVTDRKFIFTSLYSYFTISNDKIPYHKEFTILSLRVSHICSEKNFHKVLRTNKFTVFFDNIWIAWGKNCHAIAKEHFNVTIFIPWFLVFPRFIIIGMCARRLSHAYLFYWTCL